MIKPPIAAVWNPSANAAIAFAQDFLEHHVFVIADNAEEPGLSDELQTFETFGPAINEVSNGKKAIPAKIEIKSLQGTHEDVKFTMDVANDKVATQRVARNLPDRKC